MELSGELQELQIRRQRSSGRFPAWLSGVKSAACMSASGMRTFTEKLLMSVEDTSHHYNNSDIDD